MFTNACPLNTELLLPATHTTGSESHLTRSLLYFRPQSNSPYLPDREEKIFSQNGEIFTTSSTALWIEFGPSFGFSVSYYSGPQGGEHHPAVLQCING
ncbi:hypothetical protein DPEC_G00103950 [Dallia pectoralis]|uniref:Uncharacterized protein n=1 Tax=Dallia pectoralis TaxID=75939 RepID=A0ACC2GX90_DALPE|nr:hypothetical protein DPEC_G00103950 [Dallia pectoralis]